MRWDVALDQSLPITFDIIVTDLENNAATFLPAVAFETNPNWLYDPANNAANQYTITGLTANKSYNIKVVASDALGNSNAEDVGMTYSTSAPLSNPIVDGAITLDGDLIEWSSLSSYPSDPDDVVGVSDASNVSGPGHQANWRQIQVAHTSDMLYFAFTSWTNIYISWGFQIFIDSDSNPNTGFSGLSGGIDSFPIGADYLIEGVKVHQYNSVGTNWDWIDAPAAGGFEVGRIWSGPTGEVFLPRAWIGSPTGPISFICFGNNEFYGHTGEYDWYPDNAVSGGAFRYSL